MEQVYFATALAFAIIGRRAFLNRKAWKAYRESLIGMEDADGRIWLLTHGSAGFIGGEFIEE